MYKHLLVPTDGSELSAHAVSNAVSFAKSLGARITFVYVQPDYPRAITGEGAAVAMETQDEFRRATADQAESILAAAMAAAEQAGVVAQRRTTIHDAPYMVIIETAKRDGCDLIFMASHGRRGIVSLLLGSETQKVLTHCNVPVLVYREKKNH